MSQRDRRAFAIAAILLVAGSLGLAVFWWPGGGDDSAATAPEGATSAAAGPSSTLTVEPSPLRCADPTLRPESQVAASLGDPVCFEMPGSGGVELVVDGGDVVQTYLAGAASPVVVPDDQSPYGPSGCAAVADARLQISVSAQGAGRPELTAAVACLASGDAAACPPLDKPPEGIDSRFRSDGGRCLYWTDRVADEQWFLVELTYHRMKHVFAYVLPAGSTVLALPEEAEPVPASVSPERCLETKDVTIRVTTVLPGKRSEVLAIRPIIAEC